MKVKYTHAMVLSVLLCAAPMIAVAGDSESASSEVCVSNTAECKPVGKWDFSLALGAGGRTNPLVNSDDQPILLVPQFSWYGKKFFLDNFEFGFTLVDTPSHMFNVLGSIGLDHIFFEDFGVGNFVLDSGFNTAGEGFSASSPPPETTLDPDDAPIHFQPPPGRIELAPVRPLTGTGIESNQIANTPVYVAPENHNVALNLDDLSSRRLAVLGGLEYSYFVRNWQMNLQLLSDISNVHQGQEFRLATSYSWVKNKNSYVFATGLAWQSAELLDYYYGLDVDEVDNPALVFNAEAGISTFVKFSWNRKLSDKWSLLSTLHYKKLDSSLTDSPLIEEDGVTTVFIGGSYHF